MSEYTQQLQESAESSPAMVAVAQTHHGRIANALGRGMFAEYRPAEDSPLNTSWAILGGRLNQKGDGPRRLPGPKLVGHMGIESWIYHPGQAAEDASVLTVDVKKAPIPPQLTWDPEDYTEKVGYALLTGQALLQGAQLICVEPTDGWSASRGDDIGGWSEAGADRMLEQLGYTWPIGIEHVVTLRRSELADIPDDQNGLPAYDAVEAYIDATIARVLPKVCISGGGVVDELPRLLHPPHQGE